MNSIDAAIIEASIVETRLAAYDEALGRIREVMARVGQKNQAIHTANNNARLLLDKLNLVIVSRREQSIIKNYEIIFFIIKVMFRHDPGGIRREPMHVNESDAH